MRFGSAYTILAALGLLSLGAIPASAGGYKAFGEWSVNCSNGLDCEMTNYASGDANQPIRSFQLLRKPGPNAHLAIGLYLLGEDFPQSLTDLTATISIDNGAAIVSTAGAAHFDEAESSWVFAGDFLAADLPGKMKAGHMLRITISGGGKSTQADFSLQGAAASLLYLDDLQGRVDHVDAMVAKGNLPPTEAPPLKEISRFDEFPAAMRAIFADGAECEDTDELRLKVLDAFAHDLGDGEFIYGSPCGSPGAYNAPFVMFHAIGNYVSQLQFPTMFDEGPGVMTSAYNVDYDYKTQTLNAFFRGRGIGDCGSYDEWKLIETGMGRSLVLTKSTHKDDCDGEDGGGPENWPRSWPLD